MQVARTRRTSRGSRPTAKGEAPAMVQSSQPASQTNRVARGLPWGRAGKCSADRGLGAVFVHLDSVSRARQQRTRELDGRWRGWTWCGGRGEAGQGWHPDLGLRTSPPPPRQQPMQMQTGRQADAPQGDHRIIKTKGWTQTILRGPP